MTVELQTAAWIVALLALVLSWPIAQSLRHERLAPLAAYLLFVSVLVLVSAAVFMVVVFGAAMLLAPGALAGPVAAVIVVAVALIPGFAAARWVVRRPQNRRMPR